MSLHQLKVYRWNPDTAERPKLVLYTLETDTCGPMVLDALLKIKDELAPSLAFRRSCREGICGSCAMNIDGINTLACLKPLRECKQPCVVHPLPHLAVIKDLVVDLTPFYQQYAQIKPWLQAAPPNDPNCERLQSEAERARLEGLSECILCACCTTACPSYWWNGERFLGPAVLLQAYRWLVDSRDQASATRLAWLDDEFRLYRCHTIFNCTQTCPKNLNPAKAIAKIKQAMLQQ